jgi:4-alpha-glucanotransferase
MTADDALDRLSALHGIVPHYYDAMGRHHVVTPETKRALLAALGVAAGSPADIAEALEDERMSRRAHMLPPASVVNRGRSMHATVRVRNTAESARLFWSVNLEGGGERRGEMRWGELAHAPDDGAAGAEGEARALALPADLPDGYHSLYVETPAFAAEGRLIVTPPRCYLPDRRGKALQWAIAVQLYGLCSSQSWGIGDFGDLAHFARRAASAGADAVALSPIHALFPADPGHFGPYGPSSRLFLNIMHIDVTAVPGFAEAEQVRRQCETPAVRSALDTARSATLVDYEAVAAAKMPVLEALWDWFRQTAAADPDFAPAAAFAAFAHAAGPDLDSHALFDALHEHFFGSGRGSWLWTDWPTPFRDRGSAAVADFARDHADRVDFFRFLQWVADQQLARAHQDALAAGMSIGLYRDLAIGTHPGGAMAWMHPETTVTGATVGAPPDAFNQLGQDWGIVALSPDGLRDTGFAPYTAMLRANMRHAGVLRIDHIMGLDRLFWVPAGGRPSDGAYITYPGEVMRDLLSLESRRNACMVVGEDLGTVPDGFRNTLAASGVLTYKVLYFERDEGVRFRDPRTYPDDCLVAATTHDLPPLAGFWHGRDLEWRRALGLFNSETDCWQAHEDRAADRHALVELLASLGLLPPDSAPDTLEVATIIEAVYAALAMAPCRVLAAQMEDLLCIEEQPNLPGTYQEHPNWRRKLPIPIDDLGQHRDFTAITGAIRAGRQGTA